MSVKRVLSLPSEILGFSKSELFSVSVILGIIIFASLVNFRIAERRGRDTQRKNDMGYIAKGLNIYGKDFGVFPLSTTDGKIIACSDPLSPTPCSWGVDKLADLTDPKYPAYLPLIPRDPQTEMGVNYFYISNSRRFQLYIALEGRDEDEYEESIVARGIKCGLRICNAGLSSGDTPLDKSIEEYENELLEKSKK